MQMKRLLLCLILVLFAAWPLYAQDEEAPPEDAPAEDAPEEEAAVDEEAVEAASGGGGESGLMIGFGALATISISDTDETDAAADSVFFPRGAVEFRMDGQSFEGELLVMNFEVDATGNKNIEKSTLTFTGQTYSVLYKLGDDLMGYGGYGITQFDVSQSATDFPTNVTDQTVTANDGSMIIVGGKMLFGEAVGANVDYRIMTVPVETKTDFKNTTTLVTSSSTQTSDLVFNIISIGVDYSF